MGKQHVEAVENYMKMVQGALRAPGNNYRYEIVMHLTIAYYYGLGTYLHKILRRSPVPVREAYQLRCKENHGRQCDEMDRKIHCPEGQKPVEDDRSFHK